VRVLAVWRVMAGVSWSSRRGACWKARGVAAVRPTLRPSLPSTLPTPSASCSTACPHARRVLISAPIEASPRGASMSSVSPSPLRTACGAALLLIATTWLGGLSASHAATPAASAGWVAVDPMIGTGGDGHTFPGATVPFGMIQLSPDTAMPDFKHAYKWAAGYRYEDHSILGFSHTHFSGSGHSDLGDVLLMPGVGKPQLDPGDPDQPGSGYRSEFSHASEVAQPGYYAVTLATSGVRVELTAGTRVGWHRYT